MAMMMHADIGCGPGSINGVKVNTAALREKGSSLIQHSSVVLNSMQAVGGQVGKITDRWRDATGQDFASGFQTFNESYSPLSSELAALGTFLTSFADKYEEALIKAVNGIQL